MAWRMYVRYCSSCTVLICGVIYVELLDFSSTFKLDFESNFNRRILQIMFDIILFDTSLNLLAAKQ